MNIFDKYDLVDVRESVDIPAIPKSGIVLLVGSSGSGKSTILKSMGHTDQVIPQDVPIAELFSSYEEAERLLTACGLRSVPCWLRPLSQLSNGERHRAEIAIGLDRYEDTIDEFSSVVDRDTAKSLSVALSKHFSRGGIERLIIATCHRDIIEWLQPDHIYDTDSRQWLERGSLRQRPEITLTVYPSRVEDWVYFQKHHYLSSKVSKSCHFYVAKFNEKPVAFSAVIHGCARDIKSYWRESRLVVIPEFQGLGIGSKMSEAIAGEYTSRGKRFFSKTAHSALGEYRNKHPEKWRATSTNMKSRPSYLKDGKARVGKGYGKTAEASIRDASRVCYSHEYVG